MKQQIETELRQYEADLLKAECVLPVFESDVRLRDRKISELNLRIDTLKSILGKYGDVELDVVKNTKVKRKRPYPFSGGGLDDSSESFESGYDKGFADGQRILRATIVKKLK